MGSKPFWTELGCRVTHAVSSENRQARQRTYQVRNSIKENLEKLKIVEILQGKEHTSLLKSDWNDNVPAMMLYQLRDYLYDKRYYDWLVTIDGQGFICVQARKNTPNTRLGWGVFEKDLTSRI